MNRDDVMTKLKAAMPELSERFGAKAFLLFGSFARGEQTDRSDVDLLVEFSRPATLFALGGLHARLEELLGRRVELGTADTLRPHVRGEVMSEALRVA